MRSAAPSLAALAALAALALTACATTPKYGPPRTTWDQATGSKEAEAPAAEEVEAEPEPAARLTASDVADQAETAAICLDIAKRLSGEASVALLRACMSRSDFVDLRALLQEPWLHRLRTSAKLQVRLAEVMAHRGGFLEGDLAEVSKVGIPLFSLNQALAKPATMRGALVVVRGTIDNMAMEKWGKGKGLVATIDETSWLDDDNSDDGPSIGDVERTAVERTGRTIYLRVLKRQDVKHGDEVVVVMTFEGPRASATSAGEVDSGIGMLAGVFEAAPTLDD